MNYSKLIIIFLLTLIPVSVLAPDSLEKHDPFDLLHEMREHLIRNDKADYRKNYMQFKRELASLESSNDWTRYNLYGYIGKYQFGQDALEATGFGHVNFNTFVQDPGTFSENEQEQAMDRLLKLNEQVLRPYIHRYVGHKVLDSITITRSGLLAAAHLAGPGNVKRFLESEGSFNPKDRMGTRLSDYLSGFAMVN